MELRAIAQHWLSAMINRLFLANMPNGIREPKLDFKTTENLWSQAKQNHPFNHEVEWFNAL